MAISCLTIKSSIQEALEYLERARTKIVPVIDDDGKLVRTVVDGDIRRSFLNGATLQSCLWEIPGRTPVTSLNGASREDLVAQFAEHPSINAIILTDSSGHPVEVANRRDFISSVLLSPPHLGQAEVDYVFKAFEENWIAPAGPNLDAFELALSAACGRKHSLALSSGTAALHLALRVLGIRQGDRVYVSDLTFAASVQPILYERAEPVLIDSEPISWNMSPDALNRRLQKDAAAGQLPKAIILVHLYGQPADLAAIIPVAEHYGVPIIEDAAESLGAKYGNLPSGAHGMLSAFSFNGNKIITTSGGGALVSDRKDLIDVARMLSTQGRAPAEHYQHDHVAYNYRMSNVLAGIGLGQLEKLADRVAQRRAIFARYHSELSHLPGVSFQSEHDGSLGNRWLTVVTLDPDEVTQHPYQLLRALRANGVESRPAWKPMHMQPLCRGMDFEPHSRTDVVSSRLFLQSLCLPSGSDLSEVQQTQVISLIKEFVAG